MSSDVYRIDRDGPIVTLTLTRPNLMNRIDGPAHTALVSAFRSLETMEDVRAVIFAAEGKVFSAGGDFDLLVSANQNYAVRRQIVDEAAQLINALLAVAPPIVVAMQGDAIGLGATLALACDSVVTHASARISDPHVAIGLVAGDGGCLVWPQTLGMQRAKQHLLRGVPLDGKTAYDQGLVTEVVWSAEDVLPTATKIAVEYAALPPLAVQGTKRTLNAALRKRLSEVLDLGLAEELTTMASADHGEAIAAFRERRQPTYRNF